LSKKKLTNKEITSAISQLSMNDEMLLQRIESMRKHVEAIRLDIEGYAMLYLDYKKETKSFDKFVNHSIKVRQEEFEKKAEPKDKA
tara:strand:- start:11904 stop:12161 length:258 start_codon:yes stop_codon:yes gene_type:complete